MIRFGYEVPHHDLHRDFQPKKHLNVSQKRGNLKNWRSLMRKWLSVLLLLVFLIMPTPTGAQAGVKLESINIVLWSEFDQPSMLVIHEFIVDETVALPVDVTVRFPEQANLTAVATVSENSLVNIGYTEPEIQGSWQTVTLSIQSYAPYRIEYYQPLTRDGDKREFSFRWFGDYAVDMFSLAVQFPADSRTVVTEPAIASMTTSEDGLHRIGTVSTGSLKMGKSFQFEIEYERDSETVTKPQNSANVQAAEPVGPNTEGRISIDNLPYIIGGFGLALIALALFFYWRSTQTPERRGQSRKRRRSGSSEDSEEDSSAYCHECGTRAHKGDRFCRTCGSRLRA
jgi:hypothetical protein